MPAFAALTLKNNAATDVVFSPSNIQNGITRYTTQDSVYDARSVITTSVTLPKTGGQVARLKQKIVIPVMDAVDATKKIGECFANIDVVFPKQASETQRLNLRAYVKNLTADAVSTAAYQYLEDTY